MSVMVLVNANCKKNHIKAITGHNSDHSQYREHLEAVMRERSSRITLRPAFHDSSAGCRQTRNISIYLTARIQTAAL